MNKFFSKIAEKVLEKAADLFDRAAAKITEKLNRKAPESAPDERAEQTNAVDIESFHEEIQDEIAANRERMDRERKRNLRERLERSSYSDYETSFDNIVPSEDVVQGAKYRDAVDKINRARARRDPTGEIERKIGVVPGKEKEFFEFLHSDVLKNLRGVIDSDIVVDYVSNRLSESSLDQIMLDVEDYMRGELSEDEFMEEILLAYD